MQFGRDEGCEGLRAKGTGIGYWVIITLKEMIAYCQKVVAFVPVTAHHLCNRIITIRSGAMGMQVPLVETPR